MGGRSSSSGKNLNSHKEISQTALNLYSAFINGNSNEIHRAAESDKVKLDSVFTPAKESVTVYKGMAVSEEDIQNLSNINNSYSSTSFSRTTSVDYANRAYDMDEGFIPLVLTVHVAKGTPVANARELLGEGGMRSFEQELTIGRHANWTYTNLRRQYDSVLDEYYYTADAYVSGRRKK